MDQLLCSTMYAQPMTVLQTDINLHVNGYTGLTTVWLCPSPKTISTCRKTIAQLDSIYLQVLEYRRVSCQTYNKYIQL